MAYSVTDAVTEGVNLVSRREFELLISMNSKRVDAELVDALIQRLIGELFELPEVQSIRPGKTQNSVPGAKGDTLQWGTILVTLAASGGVLTSLITVLQAWLARHEKRSLVLEIDGDKLEITGMSNAEQKELVEIWLKRHTGVLLPGDE